MTSPAYEADCVVVGGGIAGLVAALRLAQDGRKVLLLEKQSEEHYLNNSRMTSGSMHCCSLGLNSDPATLRAAIHERSGGEARDDLVDAMSKDGMRVINFLRQAGVEIRQGEDAYRPQMYILQPAALDTRGYAWKDRGGDLCLRLLEKALTGHGGKICRGHLATGLLREGGKVAGVTGTTKEGELFSARASAIVLAGGGFEANIGMLRKYGISHAPEKLFARHAGAGTGEVLDMALAAGAAMTQLGGFYAHVLSRSAFHNKKLWTFPTLDPLLQAGMIVGPDARRFTDEGMGAIHVANAMARLHDPSSAVVVVDQKIWELRGTNNPPPPYAPNPLLLDLGGEMHSGSTLEELALKAGFRSASLVEEVRTYNAALRSGALASLTPPRSSDKFEPWPIETGPFLAFPACAGLSYTMDGISIDASGRTLDAAGNPIEGLYAVGCATGGLEGGKRAAYVNGMLKSTVTALRAAEHILAS